VSSTSPFDVNLSENVLSYLRSLPPAEAQSLALHLSTFYKNATPQNSRALKALVGEKNDRVWLVGVYEVFYVFLPQEHRVEVALIRRKD
jgi:hypothetical protein